MRALDTLAAVVAEMLVHDEQVIGVVTQLKSRHACRLPTAAISRLVLFIPRCFGRKAELDEATIIFTWRALLFP